MKKTMKKIIILIIATTLLLSDFLLLGANISQAAETIGVSENKEEKELKAELQQQVEKLIQLKDDKLLMQESIVVKLSEEAQKQEETIKTKAVELNEKFPESAKILLEGKELEANAYNYKAENGELTINLNSKSSTDSWNKQEETYKIIYEYSDAKIEDIQEKEIELNSNIKISTESKQIVSEYKNVITLEQKGESVSLDAQITDEIYKGYLYQANQFETKYAESYEIEISNLENVENIKITNEEENFTNGEETYSTNNSTYYKQTIIRKDNILDLLGKDGSITIKYENKEIKINKDTETNGAGEIIINYENSLPNKIEIETSKPEKLGTLEIKNQKAIKANTGYSKEQIKSIQTLKETIKANNSTHSIEMKLLDTKPEVKLALNKTSLSTMIENNIEMSVILKTNANKNELFKNPQITLELPEEIEAIKIDAINLLYETELKIVNHEINGRTITINLEGEQTAYKEAGIEGALLVINANVQLNKKSPNANRTIKATVVNNENVCQNEKEIKVMSPKEIITINSIKELNIETIGEETKIDTNLEVGAENKLVRVTSEVINNTEDTINNTAILGRFPTNGELNLNNEKLKNNLNAIIRSNITVEENKAEIYYSKNENATSDLEKSENGWTKEVDNIQEVRSYLIVAKEQKVGESIKFEYDVEIPEKLMYDQEAYIGYKVEYNKQQIRDTSKINSTYIRLRTGVGPEIDTSLFATIGGETVENGATIRAGEVLKLKVRVSNTGSVDIENVELTSKIPEGTTLVKPIEAFEYAGAVYYEEQKDTEYKSKIDLLKVGETITKEYEIRVNNDVKDTNLSSKTTVKYGELEKDTNEITLKTQSSDLRVTVKKITKSNNPIYTKGGFVRYFTIVENISNKAKNNVVVNTKLPEFAKVVGMYQYNGTAEKQELQEETIEYKDELNIGKLEPGEVKILEYSCDVNDENNTANTIKFSANVKEGRNIYRSNEIEDKLTPINISMTITSSKNSTYLKSGDEVKFTINVKSNMNKEDVIVNATTKTTIPSEFTVKKISYNGEELSIDGNKFSITRTMEGNAEGIIEVEAVVDYSEARNETQEVTVESIAEVAGQEVAAAKQTYIIEKDVEQPNGENNNQANVIKPEEGNTANGDRTISGIAWLDENQNGKKEKNEKVLNDITVQVLNARTNKLVVDKDGKVLEVKTDNEGRYLLNNLTAGEYIVIFKYDNKEYALTTYKVEGASEEENSNAILKDLQIGEEQQKLASTDIIKITNRSIENINLGLVTSQMFDMKLDKYVSKVIVQNSKGTFVREYNNETLAKAEIDKKQLAETTVLVEYKIKVTNQGEVSGYARKVADYLPTGMTFNSELNGTWYQTENTLYTTSLANERIAPGETKEVTLTLTKRMTATNTGTVTNTAEIAEVYNEQGLADINSTPANKVETENDLGRADVILSVGTGGVTYALIAIIVIAVFATIAVLIKKEKINIKKFKI